MNNFAAMLSLLIPKVINMISTNDSISEILATYRFYNSQTYTLLENEKTGLWHYSSLAIYHIYKNEVEKRELLLPEEV